MVAVQALWQAHGRQRLASWAIVAVIVAVGSGAGVAAIAAARRTASAYPRALQETAAPDVVLEDGAAAFPFDPTAFSAGIRAHPDVVDEAMAVALAVARVDGGQVDLSFPHSVSASVDGRRYYETDRVTVLEGRMPARDRADEILVNRAFADDKDIEVGDVLRLGAVTTEEAIEYEPGVEVDPRLLDFHVVGVGVLPDEVVVDDVAGERIAIAGPALVAELPESQLWRTLAVRLKPGTDVDEFLLDAQAILSNSRLTPPDDDGNAFGEDLFAEVRSTITERTQRAIRPHTLALAVVGALALVATAVIAGQALARLTSSGATTMSALRAVGARPAELMLAALVPASVTVVLGVIAGSAVALALSTLGSIGPVRVVDVSTGVRADLTALAGGMALVALMILGRVALAGRSTLRQIATVQRSAAWRSSAADMMARVGAPPVAVIGVRHAVGTGARRAAARLSVSGCAAAVAAMVALVVLAATIAHLVDTPRLYGAPWDATVMSEHGYGQVDVDALRDDPDVGSLAAVTFMSATIEGVDVPLVGMLDMDPGVYPPVVSGHFPIAPGEVALGEDTLRAVGRSLGDEVDVLLPFEQEARRFQIVGTVVLPAVGLSDLDRPGLSHGGAAVLPNALFDPTMPLLPNGIAPSTAFVKLRDRAAIDEFVARYDDEAANVDVYIDPKPADVAAFDRLGSGPLLIGALFLLTALATLGHGVVSAVRAHRGEHALLAALGMRPRQRWSAVLIAGVTIAAAALAIGIPVGLILGRWAWRVLAQEIGILPEPVMPGPALLLIVMASFVLAVLVSSLPARAASRLSPASGLRSE